MTNDPGEMILARQRRFRENSGEYKVTAEYDGLLGNLAELSKIRNPDTYTRNLIDKGRAIAEFNSQMRKDSFSLMLKIDADLTKSALAVGVSPLLGLAGAVGWVVIKGVTFGQKDIGYDWKDVWGLVNASTVSEGVLEPQVKMVHDLISKLKEYNASLETLYASYNKVCQGALKKDYKMLEAGQVEYALATLNMQKTYAALDGAKENYGDAAKEFHEVFDICAKFMISAALVPIGGMGVRAAGSTIRGAIMRSALVEDAPLWAIKMGRVMSSQLTAEAALTNAGLVLVFSDDVKKSYSNWLKGEGQFSDFMGSFGVDWAKTTLAMMAFDFGLLGLSKAYKPLWDMMRGVAREKQAMIAEFMPSMRKGMLNILDRAGLDVGGRKYILDEIERLALDPKVSKYEVYNALKLYFPKADKKAFEAVCENVAQYAAGEWKQAIMPMLAEKYGVKMFPFIDKFLKGLSEQNPKFKPAYEQWAAIPAAQRALLAVGAVASVWTAWSSATVGKKIEKDIDAMHFELAYSAVYSLNDSYKYVKYTYSKEGKETGRSVNLANFEQLLGITGNKQLISEIKAESAGKTYIYVAQQIVDAATNGECKNKEIGEVWAGASDMQKESMVNAALNYLSYVSETTDKEMKRAALKYLQKVQQKIEMAKQ